MSDNQQDKKADVEPKVKSFKKSHYEFWAGWFIHGGPHIAWLAAVFAALYSMGLVNVPAWSSDVKLVAEKVTSLQSKLSKDSVAIQKLAIDSAAAKERDISLQTQLTSINSKLSILLTNALSNNK